MAKTYEPIASNILTSAAASVTFSSIPQTYTDLVIVTNAATTSGTAQTEFLLNGDTGSNYSFNRNHGDGTTPFSSAPTNVAFGQLSWGGYLGSAFGQTVVAFINNYSNTSVYKHVVSRNSNPAYGTGVVLNMWRSSAAITSILMRSDAATYAIGSSFTLYGIKAA